MQSATDLQLARDAWFQSICEDILGWVGEPGRRLPRRVRADLGPTDLVAAIAVADITTRLARATSVPDTVRMVSRLNVLRRQHNSADVLAELVDAVELAMSSSGLPGAHRWSPDTTHQLLVEYWVAQRQVTQPWGRVVGELADHWEITAPRVLEYFSQLEARPLDQHRTLTDRMVADGNEVVQALIAQEFLAEPVHEYREAVMNAMNVSHVEHLRAMAVDILTAPRVERRCRAHQEAAFSRGYREATSIATRASELAGRTVQETVAAAQKLTLFERELLAPDADRCFQNAVLDAYLERYRYADLRDRTTSKVGTFGGLPWMRIVTDSGSEEHKQAHSIAFEDRALLDVARDDRGMVFVHLFSPDGRWFDSWGFALNDIHHLCFLLLLGRREFLGLDVAVRTGDTEERLGTVSIAVPDAPAATLRSVATQGLRDAFGVDGGMFAYGLVRNLTETGLANGSEGSWARPSDRWTAAR